MWYKRGGEAHGRPRRCALRGPILGMDGRLRAAALVRCWTLGAADCSLAAVRARLRLEWQRQVTVGAARRVVQRTQGRQLITRTPPLSGAGTASQAVFERLAAECR